MSVMSVAAPASSFDLLTIWRRFGQAAVNRFLGSAIEAIAGEPPVPVCLQTGRLERVMGIEPT
jgi:hypothetical protein